MNYKTGYQITNNGYLIGSVEVRENPRKLGDFSHYKNIIFIELLEEKPFTIRKWNGEVWLYENDFRGRWWNKTSGEEIEAITEIGKQVDLGKYTNNPPDGRFMFKYFNDLTGVWEENTVLKAEEERKQSVFKIQKQLDALDLKKMRYLIEKESGDLSGKKYFDEYESETVKLREELKSLGD